MKPPELLIVGGGVAGAASALRAAQYHLASTWITGDKTTWKSSRSAYVLNIDNMVGVHPDIIGGKVEEILRKSHPEAAEAVREVHMHVSTEDVVRNARERIEREFGEWVEIVDEKAVEASRSDEGFEVISASGRRAAAGSLILATGVMDRQPVIHRERGGRDLSGIHWVFPYANHETLLYCIRCEGHLTAGRSVGIIGAGSSAAEIALAVRERYGSEVVLLTAGETPSWTGRHHDLLAEMGVDVVAGRITGIEGADRGATLKGFIVEGSRRVDVDLAFVAMGLHRVFNDLAVALGAELERSDLPPERRHVLVNSRGETSVRGLFAVGDMAQRTDERIMKQIYTAQEYAVRAVDTVDRRRRSALRRKLLGES